MARDMRQLKLDDAAITAILNRLDAQDARADAHRRLADPRFPYRVASLRVDVVASRDVVDSYVVASRCIGRTGMSFLISQVLHNGNCCRIHLITNQNSWQKVSGKVSGCRYIEGSVCAHEVDVEFDQPIDPALFAPSAIRARVLLADDSAMARRLFAHLLQPLNVELVCVENGVAAVREALGRPFDLILMDTEMPQLDGLSAAKLLRQKGYIRPIAAVSSKTTDGDRDACLLAGCDEFIPKPPKRDRLADVVQRTRPQPLVSSCLHEPGMPPLIDEFVLDLLRRSSELEQAYHNRDLNLLAGLARELKGEAGGFGFESITTAAARVEAAIDRGVRLTELRPLLSHLVRLCLAARPATCDAASRFDGSDGYGGGDEFTAYSDSELHDEFVDDGYA